MPHQHRLIADGTYYLLHNGRETAGGSRNSRLDLVYGNLIDNADTEIALEIPQGVPNLQEEARQSKLLYAKPEWIAPSFTA